MIPYNMILRICRPIDGIEANPHSEAAHRRLTQRTQGSATPRETRSTFPKVTEALRPGTPSNAASHKGGGETVREVESVTDPELVCHHASPMGPS